MAKSKSFFGLRTGSTKSLTFQVYRGQQITKDRVTRVSNPRSEAQMKQRAIIPIVAASRAALKGLVDHSFEGVNYGNDSLKKFSELNLRAGALNVVSYSPNGISNPGFAELIVSKGSLPLDIEDPQINEDRTGVKFLVKSYGTKELSFKAAKAGDSAEATLKTIAEWGATNCQMLAGGNQLTFLTISNTGVVTIGKNQASLSTFDICRILFPSSESTPAQIEDVNSTFKVATSVQDGATEITLQNSKVMMTITSDKPNDQIIFEVVPMNNPAGSPLVGGALIRSAYINNVWKRSTSKIVLPDKTVDPVYTYEMWRSSYESTGSSAKYLNQGSEGPGIA